MFLETELLLMEFGKVYEINGTLCMRMDEQAWSCCGELIPMRLRQAAAYIQRQADNRQAKPVKQNEPESDYKYSQTYAVL